MVLVTADVLGAPCRLSLMARDLRAVESFYGAVLGWTFRRGVGPVSYPPRGRAALTRRTRSSSATTDSPSPA